MFLFPHMVVSLSPSDRGVGDASGIAQDLISASQWFLLDVPSLRTDGLFRENSPIFASSSAFSKLHL